MPETARYPGLAGRVALVTGGSRGIGAETCRALAANGARVAVNGRDQAAIDRITAECAELGAEAIGVAADATTRAGLLELRAAVEERLGPVELLAPFAGGFKH